MLVSTSEFKSYSSYTHKHRAAVFHDAVNKECVKLLCLARDGFVSVVKGLVWTRKDKSSILEKNKPEKQLHCLEAKKTILPYNTHAECDMQIWNKSVFNNYYNMNSSYIHTVHAYIHYVQTHITYLHTYVNTHLNINCFFSITTGIGSFTGSAWAKVRDSSQIPGNRLSSTSSPR